MTKNLVISILVGISIVGGAFWMRYGSSIFLDSARNKSLTAGSSVPIDEASNVTVDHNSTEQTVTSTNDPIIKVADLPNVNGLPADYQGPSASLPTVDTSSQTASTLAYDDLADKNLLYTEGALKYSAKDIQVKTATNRATLLTYGTNLTKILNGYPFYTNLTPPEITFNIYSGKDRDDTGIAELEATRISYEAITKRLLAASVPSGLINLHIKLINSSDRVAQLIKNMELVQTDKLLALNSARQYVEEAKFLITILTDISVYLKDKNVDVGEGNKLKLAVDVIN